MLVVGYKTGANFTEAARVIKKHTTFDNQTVNSAVSQIRDGHGVTLPDDFVLREDLVELKFLIA
jgi:hypothetical protein